MVNGELDFDAIETVLDCQIDDDDSAGLSPEQLTGLSPAQLDADAVVRDLLDVGLREVLPVPEARNAVFNTPGQPDRRQTTSQLATDDFGAFQDPSIIASSNFGTSNDGPTFGDQFWTQGQIVGRNFWPGATCWKCTKTCFPSFRANRALCHWLKACSFRFTF